MLPWIEPIALNMLGIDVRCLHCAASLTSAEIFNVLSPHYLAYEVRMEAQLDRAPVAGHASGTEWDRQRVLIWELCFPIMTFPRHHYYPDSLATCCICSSGEAQ